MTGHCALPMAMWRLPACLEQRIEPFQTLTTCACTDLLVPTAAVPALTSPCTRPAKVTLS